MDEQTRQLLDYARREERRRCQEQVNTAWHDGLAEGKEEGYFEGYKTGFRKGWTEAGGDPKLAEAYGIRPDDRAWARGVLHLPPDASLEEAQKAYRTLSKLFHPDLNPDLGDRPFKTLSEAKRILGF
jgi:hypothetical protein